jgi:hypothetical protein
MQNEFNRKPSPKTSFSRKGKRHVEERRERAPWDGSRASPIPCAESTGASVLVLGTPSPISSWGGSRASPILVSSAICECVFLTVDDVTASTTNSCQEFWQARPFPIFQCCIRTLAIGLEIETTFSGASLGLSIALPGLSPVPRTK